MANLDLHRDFSFKEWSELFFEDKREVLNHYWDPCEPGRGKSTRQAIIKAFCKAYPEIVRSALEIGYGYFGWYVGCIYVIIDASIRVPRHFSDISINKGIIINKVSEDTVHVKWRSVGGADKKFKLNTQETFQPKVPAEAVEPRR